MGGRRKNPHPKRAENARTVLKEEKEEPKVLCLKIPPPVVDEVVGEVEIQDEIIRKEMTTCSTKKAAKRKRGQHECGVCGRMCTTPSHLAIHMRIHTNEKPYECDVCEKRFRQSGGLKRHVRIHTNERPYECDVCDKAFRHSNALQNHVRTHTKEKPYACAVCEKRFSRSDSLKKHTRRWHCS
jgi:uncharacterized Zn-finger protein